MFDRLREKFNPAQPYMSGGGTETASSSEPIYGYRAFYDKLEVVNRGVNMIVDDAAAIRFYVGVKYTEVVTPAYAVRKKTLERLLNVQPNPYQSISEFRRACLLDFVIDGNIFIYWDGAHMYHVPAERMTVVSDAKTFVAGYEFDGGQVRYNPNEIIHIKDNSYATIYRGASRLKPALDTMQSIVDMKKFRKNFFDNGAVPGLVLTSEERINARLKDQLQHEWSKKYNPKAGGRRPLILDGGMKVDKISNVNFKELDFQASIAEQESIVLKALGVPPLLLDSGNNANLRPNHRLYYLETVLPIIEKISKAYERFFGWEVTEDANFIHALRPELRDEAAYWSTLVNAGIVSPNEARDNLGLVKMDGHDDLRIPANIAGSASNPSEGGRPSGSGGGNTEE